MNLNEWKDSNGNKINPSSSAASTKTSSGSSNQPKANTSVRLSYIDRIKKLLDYQIAEAPKYWVYKIENPRIDVLTENTYKVQFRFKEHLYVKASGKEYKYFEKIVIGSYDKSTGSWTILVYMDDDLAYNDSGNDFNNFIEMLTKRLEMLPKIPNSLYQDILESVNRSQERKSLGESAPTSIADDFKLYENLWD